MQDLVEHIPAPQLLSHVLDLSRELEQIQRVAVLLVHLGVADDARVASQNVREQRAYDRMWPITNRYPAVRR
jgi:hypothetical protein